MRNHSVRLANHARLLLLLLGLAGPALAQGPMTSFCSPGQGGAIACPCSNPPAGPGRGCDNSSTTGGAQLSAIGAASISQDTLVFSTAGEKPTATSIVLQGSAASVSGLVFGQGVRCVAGSLKRLYVKNAVGGSISAPEGSDPSVSARSAALGDVLSPGMTRTYAVYYRDPVVLGGCLSSSTFNITQSGSVTWTSGPALIAIQPGSFQQGSNAPDGPPYFGDFDDPTVRQVTISYGFWMGAMEVTQAQYQALMGTNPSQSIAANNPVERVSWFDAQAYCEAMTQQQAALGNVPAGYHFRLPTEAEWEYACRAGSTTEYHMGAALLCSGANLGYSNHSNSACGGTAPVAVASYAPNAWGLYDMHGNVTEWCLDSFGLYSAGPVTDPFTNGSSTRITRGGSWSDVSNICRAASRGNNVPGTKNSRIGFRVVLGPIIAPTTPALVPIPAGSFQQGSNAPAGPPYYGEYGDPTVRQVSLSYSFWMGATEVTQEQFESLMGSNPSSFQGADNPVEWVTWSQAQDYCLALTIQQSALGNVPAGYHFRLPTEAEWEYACRAGTTGEFNTGAALFCSDARFSYSYHNPSSCASFNPLPVKSYAPNAWGLYDMHGNVREWCLDSHAPYAAGPLANPFVTGGAERVLRGGGWDTASSSLRSAFRGKANPEIPQTSAGFRVVLAPVLFP